MTTKGGRELSAEEAAEMLSQWHWHGARASAYEEAAALVTEEAKVTWARGGEDGIAERLRKLAGRLATLAKVERQRQAERRTD